MALDKDLQDLFSSYRNNNTYEVDILSKDSFNKNKCKKLCLKQFQQLVQATVDNPITQHNFYSVINSVMAENLLDVNVDNLTVVDRLLFIIKSRIEDISPELKLDDGTVINLNQVYNDVLSNISKNQATFEPFTLERNGLVIHLQLSNIKTENLINEEVYSKENYLNYSNDEVKD